LESFVLLCRFGELGEDWLSILKLDVWNIVPVKIVATNFRTNIHFCGLDQPPLLERLENRIGGLWVFFCIGNGQAILKIEFL